MKRALRAVLTTFAIVLARESAVYVAERMWKAPVPKKKKHRVSK